MRNLNGFLTILIFLCLGSGMSHGAAIEVVQSVPVETTLAVAGIRDARDVWLEMIQSAKQAIDLEQFYISDKAREALEPVLDALEAAAKRGVRVRLVADALFYKTNADSVDRIAAFPNSEARIIDFSPGVQHAKFFIVDAKEVFMGSQNFDWRALSHIHEIGLRVEDSGVSAKFGQVFELDWSHAKTVGTSRLPAQPQTSSLIRPSRSLVVSAAPLRKNPPGIPSSLNAIVALIDAAKKSVRVQVMDYNTKGHSATRWTALEDALRRAAGRGASVQLLLDVGHAKKAQEALRVLARIPNVEVKVVAIPEWSGGHIDYARLVHSKYLVVDDVTARVGTENWSEEYFTETRNTGISTRDAKAVRDLTRVFERVWNSSYAATFGK